MGVNGPAIAGLECDVVGLTGVGAAGLAPTATRVRFAVLSSSATSTLDPLLLRLWPHGLEWKGFNLC
jgi:hypothetical protein